MENGARVIKGFILSVPESVSRLWYRAGQLESQQLPPPTINEEEELVKMFHAKQEMEWQKTLISICFTSGLEIALYFHQITHSKPDSLHLLSILVAILFSCLFVSHFINPTKFPRTSKVLGKVAVFLAATVFFITISIPFPPGVKWAAWIIYAISLLLQSAISATRHELYMAYIFFFLLVFVFVLRHKASICMLEGVEIQCNHGVIYNHVVAAVILVKPKSQMFRTRIHTSKQAFGAWSCNSNKKALENVELPSS